MKWSLVFLVLGLSAALAAIAHAIRGDLQLLDVSLVVWPLYVAALHSDLERVGA
jgi:hypothetical protein